MGKHKQDTGQNPGYKNIFKRSQGINTNDPELTPLDIEYMNEVDAAMHRYGNPKAYIISIASLIFFVIFIIWAAFTELDEITRGTGQVVSAQKIQEIQYLEGGVLETLMVKEGDDVLKGQIVARISNAMAASVLQEQKNNQALLQAIIYRLEAQRNGIPLQYDPDFTRMHPSIIEGQTILYQSQMEQFETEIRMLKSQLDQLNLAVREARTKQNSLQSSLKIAGKQLDAVRKLVEKDSFPVIDFMDMEKSFIAMQGDLDAASQAVSRNQSAVKEAEDKIKVYTLSWQSNVQEELNKKRAELYSVSTLLEGRGDAVTRTDLRSPVNGKIKKIYINTQGGSVAPGETIMDILPTDDKLLIETRIRPADRAFLHTADEPAKKQRAIVKIDAYDFSIYGGLEATLEHISDDTIENRRGEFFYEVRLLTTSNAIVHQGEALQIMPGMTATVDIITGKKTILAYLLKPILKAKNNALRER